MKIEASFVQDGIWWVGWTDDVPGALTQGESLEEVRENLIDAVKMIREPGGDAELSTCDHLTSNQLGFLSILSHSTTVRVRATVTISRLLFIWIWSLPNRGRVTPPGKIISASSSEPSLGPYFLSGKYPLRLKNEMLPIVGIPK